MRLNRPRRDQFNPVDRAQPAYEAARAALTPGRGQTAKYAFRLVRRRQTERRLGGKSAPFRWRLEMPCFWPVSEVACLSIRYAVMTCASPAGQTAEWPITASGSGDSRPAGRLPSYLGRLLGRDQCRRRVPVSRACLPRPRPAPPSVPHTGPGRLTAIEPAGMYDFRRWSVATSTPARPSSPWSCGLRDPRWQLSRSELRPSPPRVLRAPDLT